MTTAPIPDPVNASAHSAIQAAFSALREQYIQDLSSVQAQLKMLRLLEEKTPARFLTAWNSIRETASTEAEAIAHFTLELQNLLTIGKQSKLH
jgi:hypothetical protein